MPRIERVCNKCGGLGKDEKNKICSRCRGNGFTSGSLTSKKK